MCASGSNSDVKCNEDVIRTDSLDRYVKKMLLHFIESLTIKEVSEILDKPHPHIAWDDLYLIREKLRTSLEWEGNLCKR